MTFHPRDRTEASPAPLLKHFSLSLTCSHPGILSDGHHLVHLQTLSSLISDPERPTVTASALSVPGPPTFRVTYNILLQLLMQICLPTIIKGQFPEVTDYSLQLPLSLARGSCCGSDMTSRQPTGCQDLFLSLCFNFTEPSEQ